MSFRIWHKNELRYILQIGYYRNLWQIVLHVASALIRGVGSISHVPVVFLEGRVPDGDVVVAVPVGPDPVERRPLLRQSRREPELFGEEEVQIRSHQSGVYKLGRE